MSITSFWGLWLWDIIFISMSIVVPVGIRCGSWALATSVRLLAILFINQDSTTGLRSVLFTFRMASCTRKIFWFFLWIAVGAWITLFLPLWLWMMQTHWLGKYYYRRGPEGNDIHKTNVPHMRVEFRNEVWIITSIVMHFHLKYAAIVT